MKILRVLAFSVVFLAIFSSQTFIFTKSVLALGFNPSFGVILSDYSPGVNAGVTITTTQPEGDEFLDTVTFKVPVGWDISSGATIADGATVASGTVDFVFQGTPQSVPFTFTNIADTAGHKARWTFRLPSPYCCLQV